MSKVKDNTAQATKVAEKTTEVVATFGLAKLAVEMGKNPKAVRARFRKLYANPAEAAKLPQTVKGGSRWVYAMKDRDAVVRLVGATEDDAE